jgi:hypothetical protein
MKVKSMADIANVSEKSKIRVPKKYELCAEPGNFDVLGSDADANVIVFPNAPTAAEIKATKKELAAVARVLRANGWTLDGIEESLLTEPRHAHLRYHRCRRPELYKIFEKPLPVADDWARGDKNQIIANHPQNVRHALELLGVEFRHNEFFDHLEVDGLDNWPDAELTDAGAIHARILIQENYGFYPSKDRFEEVVCDLAHASRYHPVKTYFATLTHDGTARIDTWLIDYAGAEDSLFNRSIGRLWLVAAVRRIMQPGAKFDTILVIEGLQGKNKSTAMEVLANENWFTDDLPLGEKSKQVIEQTSGVWIVEFPDLTGMSRRELNQVKSFAARRKDRARLSYGRRALTVPRQWVGGATSNDSEYLSDDQNRRFWPVRVIKFDLEKLRTDRDQLWAEAVVAEARGESITLPESLWEAAAVVQAERQIPNPFYEKLLGMIPAIDGWVTSEGVWRILEIPVERRHAHTVKVGQAMKKLGFVKDRVKAAQDIQGLRDTSFWRRGNENVNIAPLPDFAAEPAYHDDEEAQDDRRKEAQAEHKKLVNTVTEAWQQKKPLSH